MTEKQKRFCDEYLIDLNGTRAYKAAYPKVKSDDTAAAAAQEDFAPSHTMPPMVAMAFVMTLQITS